MATIFLDDTANPSRFALGPHSPVTDGTVHSNFFLGGSAIQMIGGSTLSLAFEGTSATFYGQIARKIDSNTNITEFNVTIDGGTPFTTTISEPLYLAPFYQSPTLPSASHNISFFTLSDLTVDYAAITPGNDTSLAQQRIIVDDKDASIVYNGAWARNQSLIQGATQTRLPFGNSTQQTNAVNASATFSFTGSLVSVYGVSSSGPGQLEVTFTVDGQPTPAKRFPPDGLLDPNFLWYSTDSLTPGDHTLEMQVTQSSGAYFTLDYLMYTPSFNTLATKPIFGQHAPGSTTVTSTNPSATNSGTTTSLPAVRSSSRAVLIGSVVGSVIGVTLLILLLFLWRKRISKRRAHDPNPFPPPSYSETRSNNTRDFLVQRKSGRTPTLQVLEGDQSPQQTVYPTSATDGAYHAAATPLRSPIRQVYDLLRPSPTAEVEPFHTQSPHRQNDNVLLVQQKSGLPRQEALRSPVLQPINTAIPEDIGGGEPENRVQALVVELRRELAGTSEQGRNVALRELLDEGGAGLDERAQDSWENHSVTPSSVPPPYEPNPQRRTEKMG